MAIWRPPQWQQPAMVSITVPASSAQQAQSTTQTAVGASTPTSVSLGMSNVATQSASAATPPTTYVFDAVLKLSHDQRLEKTRHPVQTGADLSSHAYLMPARLTMSIGMSDAMDAYAASYSSTQPPYITPFTGNPSKSVAAYQQMLSFQAQRIPLTVTTRLRTYTNMLVVGVEPEEDHRTISGLRMRVELEQIFTASIASVPTSTRTNDTASTGLGVVNPQTPDATTINQYGIDQLSSQVVDLTDTTSVASNNMADWLDTNPGGVDVPGAGLFSSVNTNNLQQLPAPE